MKKVSPSGVDIMMRPSTTSSEDISMLGGTGTRPPSYTTSPVAASRQVMMPVSLVT